MRYYALGALLVIVVAIVVAAALGLGAAWALRRARRG